MTKGNDIVLSMNGTPMAVATNASIELAQGVEEFTPVPGTLADDGWRHYRPGSLSWSISHDGLVSEDAEDLLSQIYSGDSDVTLSLSLPDSHTLSGTARLSEVSVVAQVKSLAKLSAKFDCNNFPSIS